MKDITCVQRVLETLSGATFSWEGASDGTIQVFRQFFFIKRPEDTSLWIEGVMVNGSQLSAPLCDM